MRKPLIILTIALLCSLPQAQAEDGATGGESQPRTQSPNIARMESQLGLTDEQVTKMREIRDAGGSREEMRAVLTPEQQARATELRKERKGDTGGRKEQMRQRLGLTDQQVKDIAEIRKNGGSRDDIRAVLTPEQQARFDSGRGKQQGGKHSSAPN